MSFIDDYLADVKAPEKKAALERVCTIVRSIIPSVEEGVSYGIPALFYKGQPLIGFASIRMHLSIYPFSGKVISRLRERLTGYELTTGSIHFSAANEISEALLGEIVAARLAEIELRAQPKRKKTAVP